MNLNFTYAGTVELNQDPLKLGRLKVRVPHVYGTSATGSGYIGTGDLPWAMPAGMPAGGSALSGGFSQIPEPGDPVWVRFLDGEPEKPIWEWGMQTMNGAQKLKLHTYDIGTPVGKPNRTVWTRYSHAIEMNEGSLIATTSAGYRIVLTDDTEVGSSDGNIMVTTPNGNYCQFDDLDDTVKFNVLQDLYFNVYEGVTGISNSFSWQTLADDFSVDSGGGIALTAFDNIDISTVGDITIDSLSDLNLTTVGEMVLGFTNLTLGIGATQQAVLGNYLVEWINSLFVWLAVHTHTSSNPGNPTSPPTQPTSSITPEATQLLSQTVTVAD